jgi:hypothetical protein
MSDRWVVDKWPAHPRRDDELTTDQILDVLDQVGKRRDEAADDEGQA